MSRIFVAGLINVETTLKVDGFPIPYFPVRYPFFNVDSSISGVGFNISKALTILGDEVSFASLVGKDLAAELVLRSLEEQHISQGLILQDMDHTAQSVIIYDPNGKRQIHTDLKDIQDRHFPAEKALVGMQGCELAVLCDINFARPMLAMAHSQDIPIATDAHTLSSLDDPYHQDFLHATSILFLSDEKIPEAAGAFGMNLIRKFGMELVVIGQGAQGSLLFQKGQANPDHVPAVQTRPVVNTIGAGDALFSCFLHEFMRDRNPLRALKWASVFASYKIGDKGAAAGFLDEASLKQWVTQLLG